VRRLLSGIVHPQLPVIALRRGCSVPRLLRQELAAVRAGQSRDPGDDGRANHLAAVAHNLSKDEIVKRSPSLADKVARRTSDATIEEIADEIAEVVGKVVDQMEPSD
ncbi:MAG: hypothetical protein ABI635_06460, partial [Actinomycetota bacterium]